MNQFLEAAAKLDRGKARRLAKLVVKSDADAPMVPSAMEKARNERSHQTSQYEAGRRREHKALRETGLFPELMLIVEQLDPESAERMVAAVLAIDWAQYPIHQATMLAIIDDATMRIRIRAGMSPFDDGLPGDPPTVFQICRHAILGVPL
jgi:hypothetical protein